MKFFKSVVLAAAIASCSLYIVDAQTCAVNYKRKDKTPPVTLVVDAQSCGECSDYVATFGKITPGTGTDDCKARTASANCDLKTHFLEKEVDQCKTRSVATACPAANSELDSFSDACVCKQGYFNSAAVGAAMVCTKEKTKDECKKLNREHTPNSDKCGACKQFYATASGAAADAKCDLIEDSKLTQTECETVLNRVWDASVTPNVCKKECKANHNTDSGALLHACFANADENQCKANADRTFNSAKKLCTCKAPKVANEILEFSSTTAPCGNGAMSSVILSASVLVAAVTGSLFYLF